VAALPPAEPRGPRGPGGDGGRDTGYRRTAPRERCGMRAGAPHRARLRTGVLAGVGASVLGGLGCAERPATTAAAGERAAPPRPADSLVATAPGGAEIWFTLARADSGDGRACVDRTIEIRRNGGRVPVPLLYTGTAP